MSQEKGRRSGYRVTVAIATGAALLLGGFTCTSNERRRDRFANSYWEHRGELRRVERELGSIGFAAKLDAETKASHRALVYRMRKLRAWIDRADPPTELASAAENLWWGLEGAIYQFPCCFAEGDTEFVDDALDEISNARRKIDSVVGSR